MEQTMCVDILKSWLTADRRTLSPEQWGLVENAFTHCSLPLYTTLVYEEVAQWHSYTQVQYGIQLNFATTKI